jgi:hypothetical protein
MCKEDNSQEIEMDGEMVNINEDIFNRHLRKKKSREQTQVKKKKKQLKPKHPKITINVPREDLLRLDDEETKRTRKRPRYLNDFEIPDYKNDVNTIDEKDSEYQVKRQMMDKPKWTEFKKNENDELPGDTLFPFVTKQYKTIRNQKKKKVKVSALQKDESSDDEDDNEYKFTKFYILDKKLPPLKKYFRPYFSPRRGSWEIDYMYSGTFT